MRDWYQQEHRNWVPVDGQRSKWWVWDQALDEARKSVRQIQTYLQRLSEGKDFEVSCLRHALTETSVKVPFRGVARGGGVLGCL